MFRWGGGGELTAGQWLEVILSMVSVFVLLVFGVLYCSGDEIIT